MEHFYLLIDNHFLGLLGIESVSTSGNAKSLQALPTLTDFHTAQMMLTL
jgi:hypothetical protein